MPIITNFNHFIENNVLKDEFGFHYKLGLPIIPQTQRGQTCKLNALSVVLNSLHTFRGMPKPLPLLKNKQQHSYSLRQFAKEKYGSQVGEIYNINILASLAVDNRFENYTIHTKTRFNDYINTIISAISNDEAPIIFYDVDRCGEPSNLGSNREHSVVVAGYFTNRENSLCFIVSQWGKYYWSKAETIFSSTSQLSSARTPENFFKYDLGWIDEYSKPFAPPNFFNKPPYKNRRAQMNPEGGFKNKILVIHNSFDYKKTLTHKEFEDLFRADLVRNNIAYVTL